MVDCADIRALKNLTASANRKRFGVTLVIGLWAVVAHHIKMKRFFIVDIRWNEHTLSVRVNTADIFAIDFDANFSRCFERKPEFFPLHILRNIDICLYKGSAVGCKIHIAFIERSVIVGIIIKIHFRNLAGIANHKIFDFPLFRINMAFEPTEAQLSPLLGTHWAPNYLNMCHFVSP